MAAMWLNLGTDADDLLTLDSLDLSRKACNLLGQISRGVVSPLEQATQDRGCVAPGAGCVVFGAQWAQQGCTSRCTPATREFNSWGMRGQWHKQLTKKMLQSLCVSDPDIFQLGVRV